MSFTRLIAASLRFYWRSNLAVACGVAVATAVLCGALLVGDSMRGSLRALALDRLGSVDQALVTDHFFRAAWADEFAERRHDADANKKHDGRNGPVAASIILLQVGIENASDTEKRASQVTLVGCDERFWRLGSGRPLQLPKSREIVLNRPLAEQLGIGCGDSILVRLPRPGAIPSESALGRKHETIRTQRLIVSEIIEPDGLGRFGLRPTQRMPHNAFVSLAWVQDQLGQSSRANGLLISDDGAAIQQLSAGRLQPTDYGLRVEQTTRGYGNITSERMLLDQATESAVLDALRLEPGQVQPALTYLANTLACRDQTIPYSTITAIDFSSEPPLGPFLSTDGNVLAPLADGEIALNAWAAEKLHANLGDTIRLSYFEPESLDGEVRETTVPLRLAAIARLSDAADDRSLAPTVKGFTDEKTIADWDPPFPFDARRVQPADEDYWDRYGPTPKAFVSLATGQRLWGSRFGKLTSIRVSPNALAGGGSQRRSDTRADAADLTNLLRDRIDPAALGMAFQPVRQLALKAAAGTTPFGVLFLCFSFFLLAAAALLVALLFRLGVEQRAVQLGTLLAIGFQRRQIERLLLGEGAAVAALGSLLGVPLGVGYAALLLLGLRTWWLPAVGTSLIRLHMTPLSLAIGALSGLVIAMAAVWLAVRRLTRIAPRRLLAGQFASDPLSRSIKQRNWMDMLLLLIAAAPTVLLSILPTNERLRAGAFFLSGAAALIALLAVAWLRLKAGRTGPAIVIGGGNLLRMAVRNAARNPGRSALTVGLMAAATFLIVAVSAFRADPREQTPSRDSGNGGFALVAESDQPIFQDISSHEGRSDLGFQIEDDAHLASSTILSLRLRGGDDASCLNLYRPRQPRVLGVPPAMIRRGGFAWASAPLGVENPWTLLEADATDAPAPVILEKNTANYSLQLWGGLGETFSIEDERGRPLRLQVVALLADSIFQGDLLISEQSFVRHFPNTSGRRFFLVDAPTDQAMVVRTSLEKNLGDYGFAVESTAERLAALLTVQNTYLSTFQSLGALGLLLGTLGLATVQLRNVLERRGELALLRATGFRRSMLARLVLFEHAALLTAGLGIGIAAALLAVLPELATRPNALPWASLLGTLLVVWLLGMAAGGLAVRAVLRAPLLAALREENA